MALDRNYQVSKEQKEIALFLGIISIIWVSVIALVLINHKPAEWLTSKLVDENDSFHSQIIINTLCTVFLMSIFLTVIGTWIGTHHISTDPVKMFFYKWTRNFAIAFFVESLIAHPIAHFVMLKIHLHFVNDTESI